MTNWSPEGANAGDQLWLAFTGCRECSMVIDAERRRMVINTCPDHADPESWPKLMNQPLSQKVVTFEEGFEMLCWEQDTFSWALHPFLDINERRWLATVLKPGMIFWDVGANNGLYTCTASTLVGPQGHVQAFEPDPGAFARLTATIAHNGLHNVSAGQAAIAHECGRHWFTLAHEGNDATLGAHPLEENIKVPGVAIDTITLDELMRFVLPRGWPDVLKVDANGTEWAVLEGARRLLETKRPIILCKVDDGPPWLGKDSRAIYDAVPDFYRWYHVRKDELIPHERQVEPFPGHANLVAVAE